jgi:hypothetical protein
VAILMQFTYASLARTACTFGLIISLRPFPPCLMLLYVTTRIPLNYFPSGKDGNRNVRMHYELI